MQFQDEIHLSVISNALWEGKDSGRAAVLIGAGFSRNAESSRINAGKFPLWGDIANSIVNHLYSDVDSFEFKNALQQAGSTSGALRLADEFIAAHGRSKLDDLIIQTIRDEDFRPGEIHRRMMELPWRDVFTTNYDTLLERAADNVFRRKYGLITNIAEISSARSPRIVKLHGSMPSQRPFILSEEDFRTYPRKFAPFVNLMQQSMMENIFCLFGFSGDDPNFLEWSGWVRDELAEWAPRLYLCGLLDLNDAKRRMLHERNVTPIDLSMRFPRNENNPDVRHRLAIEYFLKFFEDRAPLNPLRWPKDNTKSASLMLVGTPGPNEKDSVEVSAAAIPYFDQESIKRSYPGWIIAPASIRESFSPSPLSVHLEELKKIADHDAYTRLVVLDNFNWSLELCLEPLWDPVAIEVHRVLRQLNPFPTILKDWPEEVVNKSKETLSLESIQHRWLTLAVAYLRYLREERRFVEFDEWSKRLDELTLDSPQHHQRLCYERGLRALDDADDSQLESALISWTPHDSDPVWALRKAGLQAELGNVDEANKLASQALVALRRSSKGKRDIASNSREGWCMKLLNSLRQSKFEFDDKTDSSFRDRWEELDEFRCNPWIEWSGFNTTLERPPPELPTSKSKSDLNLRHLGQHISLHTKSSPFYRHFNFIGSWRMPAYQHRLVT
ncbi:MAG: SIR2 family protein [Schlesneria sp.]